MNAMIMPTKSMSEVDGASPALEVLNELLSSDVADPQEIHQRLLALSDKDLASYGLRSYRMNLMALFGERLRPEDIRRTAREAAISKAFLGWEYHRRYLPRLDAIPMPAQLQQIPVGTVKSLLAQGRGVIVVSFHIGHMRHIPSDLAHAGIHTMLPLARDAYGNYESARLENPDAALWQYLHHVCVEEVAGALALARNVARKGCVFSTIDGNTGLDGPRGGDRRSIVTMLETKARVKNGLVAMAARFGVPILPIIATTVDRERICHASSVIDPLMPLIGNEAADFVEKAISSLYTFFADMLLQSADEWCGADLFHQWRLPRAISEQPFVEVEHRLVDALERQGTVSFDTGRMMLLSDQGERVFVDVQTMKCYRIPEEERELAELLQDPDRGVSRSWIDRLSEKRRAAIWRLLCLLTSREALSANQSASLPPA